MNKLNGVLTTLEQLSVKLSNEDAKIITDAVDIIKQQHRRIIFLMKESLALEAAAYLIRQEEKQIDA